MDRRVTLLGDPILRVNCRSVSAFASDEVSEVARTLEKTLQAVREELGFGRGIAAPQVGSDLRIVFVRIDEPLVLINPTIEYRSEEMFEMWDDCLSLPELLVRVLRHKVITVDYRDLTGKARTLRAEGDLSELLQHEIDHLDGTLMLDRAHGHNAVYLRSEWDRQFTRRDGA